jgi:DNA-binding LacI/PurR family transcriptional regulator
MVNRQAVATAAGVSPYTVSVVLNDSSYGRVSPEVRDRVRAVADRLGYRPHAAGRALRLGRTELIAYVTSPQLLHEVTSYHGAIVPALLSAANDAGYDLAIIGDDSPQRLLDRLRRSLQAGRYDGVILGRPRIDDPTIEVLRGACVPFVLAGSHPDTSLYQVRRDDWGVAAGAGQRLLAHGHRHAGFASYPGNTRDFFYARARRDALRATLEAAGGVLVELPAELDEALRVAKRHGLTAIVAEHDPLAVSLVTAATDAGLAVPEQLAIASLYGVRAPLPCTPSLASVCVDPSDAGREAVRLLAAIIAGHPPPDPICILPSWYVDGGTL